MGNTKHTSVNLLVTRNLDLLRLQGFFFQNSHFYKFYPKRPWTWTKNKKVHVVVMENTLTMFQVDHLNGLGFLDLECVNGVFFFFKLFNKSTFFLSFDPQGPERLWQEVI